MDWMGISIEWCFLKSFFDFNWMKSVLILFNSVNGILFLSNKFNFQMYRSGWANMNPIRLRYGQWIKPFENIDGILFNQMQIRPIHNNQSYQLSNDQISRHMNQINSVWRIKFTGKSLRSNERRGGSIIELSGSWRDNGTTIDATGADPASQTIRQRRAEARRCERVNGRIQGGIYWYDEHHKPTTSSSLILRFKKMIQHEMRRR